MELEQRLIVCCNYRAHANDEKGQAIALYEKDKETSLLNRINEDKYFCEPEDCEVHIIPNGSNDNDYKYLTEKFKNRLYLIQCVENKNIDPNSSLSKNKSNLYKVESVEPKFVCEILDVDLPDEVNPEILVVSIPLTRHIFINDSVYVYGPFEFDVVEDSENENKKISLKKPGDTKYLGKLIPKLSTIRYNYSDVRDNVNNFNYPSKLINGISFSHSFFSNLQDLKDKPFQYYNYGFVDELSKAIGAIVKETNTRGITASQIAMLSSRIKNKKNIFTFDTDYVLGQLNDSVKFEKVITECKDELRKVILEQALNDNDQLRQHFLSMLKSDDSIIAEVKQSIKSEEAVVLEKLETLKREVSEYHIKIQEAKDKILEVDKDKENSIIEKLKQEQIELYSEIEGLKKKKFDIENQYSEIFEAADLSRKIEKLREDLKKQDYLYDAQVNKVNEKKGEIQKYQSELQELTNRSAEQYRKELLSVKNSIDVLNHIESSESTFEFQCIGRENLIRLEDTENLVNYIKYIQLALSDYDRVISIEHIINYLICVDCAFITIFSGLPGTGKTSLVNIFNDKVLNARFNSIQVGRGWSSERDLLGYFNPITNLFISSSSGLYEFLNDLNLDQRLNVVLLDEANLSPIEHYWSKFMGLTDDYDGREFVLTNNKSLKINNKLRFIATINNDMSTEPLSPRLLDRAPCIRLDVYQRLDNGSKSGLDFLEEENANFLKEFSTFYDTAFCYDDFKDLLDRCECDNDLFTNMIELIEQVQRILMINGLDGISFGSRIHLSERRTRLIRIYLKKCLSIYNHFCSESSGWVEIKKDHFFLDFAISQFILPLITGHGKSFKKRLEHLREYFVNVQQVHNYDLTISQELINNIIVQGEEDLDTYDFMSLR